MRRKYPYLEAEKKNSHWRAFGYTLALNHVHSSGKKLLTFMIKKIALRVLTVMIH